MQTMKRGVYLIVDVTEEQARRLEKLAQEKGVTVRELTTNAVASLVESPEAVKGV